VLLSAREADVEDHESNNQPAPAEDTSVREGVAPQSLGAQDAESNQNDDERLTLLQKIGQLSGAAKIQLARKGSQEERLILIRDANKSVARAVLESPRLTEHEIEAFSSMRDVSEEVLRLIGMNRNFMKDDAVVVALVNNPRAPLDVTLPLVVRLKDRELKALILNRNVASVLRSSATKLFKQRQGSH
jgi:hypothetical protein